MRISAIVLGFALLSACAKSSSTPPPATSPEPTAEPTTDGAAAARALLSTELFGIPMISGAIWSFTWGDLILI